MKGRIRTGKRACYHLYFARHRWCSFSCVIQLFHSFFLLWLIIVHAYLIHNPTQCSISLIDVIRSTQFSFWLLSQSVIAQIPLALLDEAGDWKLTKTASDGQSIFNERNHWLRIGV